jgi:hypothetical protein
MPPRDGRCPWPWAFALKIGCGATHDPTGRVRCGASPRRRVTRHPLDARRTRAVVHGALLSDGSYGLPPPTEAAASPEHMRCPWSRVSTWIARYDCGEDYEQHPAAFLASGGNQPIKIAAPQSRRHCVALPPFVPFFSANIIFFRHKSKGISYLRTIMTAKERSGKRFKGVVTFSILRDCLRICKNVTVFSYLKP